MSLLPFGLFGAVVELDRPEVREAARPVPQWRVRRECAVAVTGSADWAVTG
jgi:hypothetical protein